MVVKLAVFSTIIGEFDLRSLGIYLIIHSFLKTAVSPSVNNCLISSGCNLWKFLLPTDSFQVILTYNNHLIFSL